MPISTGSHAGDLAYEGYALVDPDAGQIIIISAEPRTLTFDEDSPLGWMTAAALALADAGYGMRFVQWVARSDGHYAMGVRQGTPPAARARSDRLARLQRSIDSGISAGTIVVEQRHRPGEPDPLAALRAAFLEWDESGASSNDIGQALDDFLTERGYPTVLYRER